MDGSIPNIGITRGLMPKPLLEFMERPSALETTSRGIAEQLRIEPLLLPRLGFALPAASRAEFDQLARNALDVRPRSDLCAAGRADARPLRHDASAFVAYFRKRLRTLALLPVGRLPLASIVEMILADVRHQAEAKVIAGMVQDQEFVLARRRPQPAADCLDKQDAAFRRLGVHNAADIEIDAGRQDADIADDPGLSRPEPSEDGLAVLARGRAVHVLAGDPDLEKSLGDMLGVVAIDAKAKVGPLPRA